MQVRIDEFEERKHDSFTRLTRQRFQLAPSVITRIPLMLCPRYSVRKAGVDIFVE